MEPTRTVRLHLENSAALHNSVLERTEDIVRRQFEAAIPPNEIEANAVPEAAGAIQEIVEDWVEHDADASRLTRDLLSNELARVDWHRIGEEWVDAAIDFANRNGVDELARL